MQLVDDVINMVDGKPGEVLGVVHVLHHVVTVHGQPRAFDYPLMQC